MKRCIILILTSLFLINSKAGINELDSLYNKLDRAIANSLYYVEKKESKIAEYKRMLNFSDITDKQLFELNMNLYAEYRPYICDSAIVYAKNCVRLAEESGDKLLIYDTYLNMSELYSLSMRFIEAKNLLDIIPVNNLPNWLRIKHFERYKQFYEYYSWDYYEQYSLYRDSLLQYYPPESDGYKLTQAEIYRERGRIDDAIDILLEMIEQVPDDTHFRAILAYVIGYTYRLKGDTYNQKKYFAISAISDVKNAVKENASLHGLARVCYETNDMKRAYKYIHKALEDAMFSNVRLRTVENSQAFPIIEMSYKEKLNTQRQRLQTMFVFICILSSFLIIAVGYVNLQIRKLKKTRKSLVVANYRLQEINNKMEEAYKNLSESNRLKEEYLGRYLDQCSGYIDKLENFRKQLDRIATVGRVEDLYSLIKSKQFLESELKDFYDDFDSSFLQLFPKFIEQFNELLLEEERIYPKHKELLNTELRIFALIRLGITDSAKIAQFLRYPVNTIYNYRTKVRNKVSGDRDIFEENVMKLGSIEMVK